MIEQLEIGIKKETFISRKIEKLGFIMHGSINKYK